jgi:hypothetical protein
MKKPIVFILALLTILFFTRAFAADAPALLFSDLTSGPKTGWEGSGAKGAAVTVWGKNFGQTRGSSYVAINGANLINDSDYAEWATSGTANGVARGLVERDNLLDTKHSSKRSRTNDSNC